MPLLGYNYCNCPLAVIIKRGYTIPHFPDLLLPAPLLSLFNSISPHWVVGDMMTLRATWYLCSCVPCAHYKTAIQLDSICYFFSYTSPDINVNLDPIFNTSWKSGYSTFQLYCWIAGNLFVKVLEELLLYYFDTIIGLFLKKTQRPLK